MTLLRKETNKGNVQTQLEKQQEYKKKLGKILQNSIEKKINNSIMQNEFKKLRFNLELSVLRDKETDKVLKAMLPQKPLKSRMNQIRNKYFRILQNRTYQ
mmetsp:Transcript_7457/g.6604  ORF Transcript_7457/g.6604 Transcript_7457/m.6604 type:complete len:100 (+) Transcript_7457:1021-1320(+)